MLRVLSALAIAAASLTFVLPAAAADETCKDAIRFEEQHASDVTAAIAADKELEAKLVAGADAREKAATAKEDLAKKLGAASEKLLDMKKKAVFRDLAQELEGQARADRAFAKERRAAAETLHKTWSAGEAALDKVKKSLAALKERCGG